MGILEGSLRMMPAWEINFLGHTISFSVLIPALLPLGLMFTGLALWPFFEQWATGDRSFHNINDRPRNAPVRTAVGVAAVSWYGVLWLEGANDVIADKFDVPLYTITWISRVAFFVAPMVAYYVTKRICLALQRKDVEMLTHGVEIGIIRQLPNGEFVEETRQLTDEERGKIDSKHVYPELPAPDQADDNGVPAPAARGALGAARAIANRAFTETIPVSGGNGHGNGHGYGHGNGNGHGAVTGDGHGEVEGDSHAAIGSQEED
jgi:ubiquinol-cytochrome c reductase cytochrome b subunit